MKELLNVGVGGDGGKLAVQVEGGMLKLELGYPVAKLLEPLKVKVLDKLKALIPGNWEDAILDKGWADLVASVSEEPKAE